MQDSFDKAGAARLGKIISDYWEKRGQVVRIEYVDAPFLDQIRSARVDIRSNMVNGKPRRVPAVLSTTRLPASVVSMARANPIPLD